MFFVFYTFHVAVLDKYIHFITATCYQVTIIGICFFLLLENQQNIWSDASFKVSMTGAKLSPVTCGVLSA